MALKCPEEIVIKLAYTCQTPLNLSCKVVVVKVCMLKQECLNICLVLISLPESQKYLQVLDPKYRSVALKDDLQNALQRSLLIHLNSENPGCYFSSLQYAGSMWDIWK